MRVAAVLPLSALAVGWPNVIGVCVGLAMMGIAGAAAAALFDRGNGLIYDDVLKVYWVQDANLCITLGNCINDDGFGGMVWVDAVSWADGLVFQGFAEEAVESLRLA